MRVKNRPLALTIGFVSEGVFLWLLIGALRSGNVTVFTKHLGFNNGAIEAGNLGTANMTQTVLSGEETPLRYWGTVLFFTAMVIILAGFIASLLRPRDVD